ncbi:type II toxin-antitoxin system RelE/ParE family toxin [Patescibacteria group bacterium]|nr:type II toxin-antitoxin system RelE/ParE family toxin [Patescibacteria group bacterium]
MKFKIKLAQSALKDLKKLTSKVSERILKKLDFFESKPNPLKHAKKLKNSDYGTYRFRIGEYRVIFDIDNKGNIKILMILRIKHRKDIYKSDS